MRVFKPRKSYRDFPKSQQVLIYFSRYFPSVLKLIGLLMVNEVSASVRRGGMKQGNRLHIYRRAYCTECLASAAPDTNRSTGLHSVVVPTLRSHSFSIEFSCCRSDLFIASLS
jgi:hypothetical protein